MVETMKKENEKLKNENQEYKEKEEQLEDTLKGANMAVREYEGLKIKIDTQYCKIRNLEQENEKLKEKLNSNVFNADCRCNQFRVKVGYSYIHDILEGVFNMDLDGYDEDDGEDSEKWKCWDSNIDHLFEECARVINNCINRKGVDEEYIWEEIESEVIDKFKHNDWIFQLDSEDEKKEDEKSDVVTEALSHIKNDEDAQKICPQVAEWIMNSTRQRLA